MCSHSPRFLLSLHTESSQAQTLGPAKGSLVIMGGGGREITSVFSRFAELAGGKDAKIVIVPTASSRDEDYDYDNHRTLKMAREKLGLTDVSIAHTHDRNVSDTEAFAKKDPRGQRCLVHGRKTVANRGRLSRDTHGKGVSRSPSRGWGDRRIIGGSDDPRIFPCTRRHQGKPGDDRRPPAWTRVHQQRRNRSTRGGEEPTAGSDPSLDRS